MKRVFVFLSFLIALTTSAQESEGVNLGTVYLRSDQHLITFDKVLYPGYDLYLENIQIHEYLMGKRVRSQILRKEALRFDFQGALTILRTNLEYTSFQAWIDYMISQDYDVNNVGSAWQSELEMVKTDRDLEKSWNEAMARSAKSGESEILYEPMRVFLEMYKEDQIRSYNVDGIRLYNIFRIEAYLELKDNKLIKEEYNIENNEEESSYTTFTDSKTTILRGTSEGKVQEIEVMSTVDIETNTVKNTETVINERDIMANEVADVEGNVYKTTTIGNQTWMAENLRATRFNDNTPIQELNEEQWQVSTSPGLLEKNPNGNFYNFHTMIADKNVCPSGFRVPDDMDVSQLYNEITPYDEHLKIGLFKVKKRQYSRWLAPIMLPLGIATHLTWWSGAAAIDVGAVAIGASVDVVYWSALATAAIVDAALVSPIIGWKTKKAQKRKDEKAGRETSGEYKLKYRPLNLPIYYPFSLTASISNALFNPDNTDYVGLFGAFPIMPYRSNNMGYGYGEGEFLYNKNGVTVYMGHKPVISLLFSNRDGDFADEYGFNLQLENNKISPISNLKDYYEVYNYYGLSYVNINELGVFGFAEEEEGVHELKANGGYSYEELYYSKSGHELLKTKTPIRCIKE